MVAVIEETQLQIQTELVKEVEKRIYATNPISSKSQNYVKRNALEWSPRLYKEIQKSVSMYYNSHKYEMDQYKVELDDLTQKVAFTLYRWQNFDPEAYGKKLYQYIIPIITQKLSKEKKYLFKTRQNISISLDEWDLYQRCCSRYKLQIFRIRWRMLTTYTRRPQILCRRDSIQHKRSIQVNVQ